LISFDKTKVKDKNYRNLNLKKPINFLFTSINQLEKGFISWKDDVESLCYILIYFLKGELPWSPIFEKEFENKKKFEIENSDSKLNYENLLKSIQFEILKSKKVTTLDKLTEDLPGILKS
jgi:hypothetical protein